MRPDSAVISVPALFMCIGQQPSAGALSRLQVALMLQVLEAGATGLAGPRCGPRAHRGYLLPHFSANGDVIP
jgi:hypothetical protein